MSSTMQAIQAADYGGPEVLKIGEAPRPEPKPNEVLIRVKAAGVNPADWKYRSGIYKQFVPLTFPWTPGLDGAGVIEGVGSEVTTLKPGQAVYGIIDKPSAQYAVAPEGNLTLKPSTLSYDEAATVPVGALTAWGAIEAIKLEAGQKVLIHGGAGGVGLFAVQLAHWKGAHVIATTSTANVDFVHSLGADEVIDYSTTKFEDVLKDLDAVIDTVGGDLAERSFGTLRKDGIYVTVAGRLAEDAGKAQGIRATNAGRAAPVNLQAISQLLESGKLKVTIGKSFPLAQAEQAHALSQTGHGRGRIILHIED
jgi:NADPH:quinone reductase-like Zn-dependent oxidoreductase